MLAKLKGLLSTQPSQNQPPLSDQFQHPQVNSKDASQCPFMKKQSKEQPQASKCPVSGKEAANPSTDSDSEQEKPKGGCPFMGTSNKKKNPDLPLKETGYDQPFVSKYKYYLSSSKIDFSILKNNPAPIAQRQVFNSYPIYLQHTLFFNGQDYKKVRNLECCSRFMAYEQLRQKGNKRFNKGRYYEALEFYERAASLFKWLQHYQPINQSTISSEHVSSSLQQSFDQLSESGSKVNIQLEQEKAKVQQGAAVFEELKSKYKEFFITYTDENTRLFDGEEMTETADIDMRKSLLIQAYLNMCAAYIHTHHYSLAERVCDDGLALSDNVSQLYFRKAQALSLNKDSPLQKLRLALNLITKAIEKRANEKIFASANENILKMLNLQNSAEAYEGCRQHIEARISELTTQNVMNYQKIYNRTKQIHQIEQRIISEGKVPRERSNQPVLYETTQMKILNRMAAKYLKVVQFYTEAKNYEQVGLAKKQFQEVLRINNEVRNLFNVELREADRELGGLETEKIKARVAYVKTAFAENVYNSGKFNFTMLEWAIKQIVKEEAEEKKKRLEASKAEEAATTENGSTNLASKRDFTKLAYLLLLVPLFGILFNMFAL